MDTHLADDVCSSHAPFTVRFGHCAVRWPMSAFGVAALLALTGCATPTQEPRPPSQAIADPIGNNEYPNVVIDPSLEGSILQAAATVSRDERVGLLTVRVPIRSTRAGELLLQYRVLFLDAKGSEQNADTPWRHVRMDSRARRVIEATSLRDDAADWRMEIRPSRPR